MLIFIEGTTTTGQVAARYSVVSRLSARPDGHLGDGVGRCRGNNDEISLIEKIDMAYFFITAALGIHFNIGRPSGQGLEGKRGNKFSRCRGHNYLDLGAAAHKQPGQFGRL
jgi:hypothetical protein